MARHRTAIDLTQGPIVPVLARQFVPLLSGSLIFASVSVAEGYFISRLGTEALAAFGQLSPFILLATGMFFGFGNGVTSTVSRAVGEGNAQAAATAASLSYVLVLPFVGVYLLLCAFLSGPVFAAMGGRSAQQALFNSYLSVWTWAVAVAVLLYVSGAVFRARGFAGVSSVMSILSALINLVLGPILMFGWQGMPRLGLQGAATSALIGMLIAGCVSVAYLVRNRLLGFTFHGAGSIARDISIGSAFAILTYCIQPIGRFLLLAILGLLGTEVLAALAVLLFIDRFMLNVFVALSSALAPFVGQNWGSRQFGRAQEGVTASLAATLVIGGSAYAALVLLSRPIAAAFTGDPAVLELIRTALAIYPAYITLSAIVLIATAAFNATANAKLATGFVSAGQLLVLPACVYLGGMMDGYVGMLGGMAVGQLAIALLCVGCLYRRVLRGEEGKPRRPGRDQFRHCVLTGEDPAQRAHRGHTINLKCVRSDHELAGDRSRIRLAPLHGSVCVGAAENPRDCKGERDPSIRRRWRKIH